MIFLNFMNLFKILYGEYPIDVIQLIGLVTGSTQSYLNLSLCCMRFLKLLQKPRRERVLRHFTRITIDEYNHKAWRVNSNLHRENGPAREYSNGRKEWYLNGKLHREDGPAIEYSNGRKEWSLNGKLHREDGPAIVSHNYKAWYWNGKCHRKDGAAKECSNDYKEWWINGKRHRENDLPAIEFGNGSKAWYWNGKMLKNTQTMIIKNGISMVRDFPVGSYTMGTNMKKSTKFK